MKPALWAEWTKLRTLPSTGWLLLATIGIPVAGSAAVLAGMHVNPGSPEDPTKLSLVGIDFGQTLIVILAVLLMAAEYGTGMIRITLSAIPRRLVLFAGKAVNIAALALVAGVLAVGGCLIVGRLLLPGAGIDPAHGYALISLTHGPTLRAAAGSVLYLALIAILSLGVAAAVRDTAASIGVVLGLIYLPPIAAQIVQDPTWRRHLEQISPMTAGLAIQATTNLRDLPIVPWAGLGVLAAWAAVALLLAGLLLRLRDA